MIRPEPTDALRAMLAEDGKLDRIVSGEGLRFAPAADPPPPPQPLQIEPPDWREEERERLRREAAPLEIVEDTTTYPAKPRPKPNRTPCLDAIREWRAEQMRGQP
jgi:hypothetical protein